MRVVLAVVLGSLIGCFVGLQARAEEKAAVQTWTGVIVDDHCAAKFTGDEAQTKAAAHPKACAIKCAAEGSLGLFVAGQYHKFDDAGTKMAKEYLGKDGSTTSAVVSGTLAADGSIAVTAIDAPPAEPKK